MACGYPVVSYQNPGPRTPSCSITLISISKWMNYKNGLFKACDCYHRRTIYGTTTMSVHATGRAVDVCISDYKPSSGGYYYGAGKMIDMLNGMSPFFCQLGLQRVIFLDKIWDANDPTGPVSPFANWRKFSGQFHSNHVHMEVTPSFASKLSYADVSTILENAVISPSTRIPPTPTTPPAQVTPTVATPTGSSAGGTSSGSGGGTGTTPARGTGTTSSGADPIVVPTATNTNPVWSISGENSGCSVCGGAFASLIVDPADGTPTGRNILYCGSTGSICVDYTTGATCSVGAAPSFGNFPGPVKDAILWGTTGMYGLSSDGKTIYNLGSATPITLVRPPFDRGNVVYEQLLAAGPQKILVSGYQRGVVVTAGTTTPNNVASDTCC